MQTIVDQEYVGRYAGELEASEVNVILDKLPEQPRNPKSDFFISQLTKAEDHASAVSKRIKALREKLAEN